jgi:carboxyl-terminal processing protease
MRDGLAEPLNFTIVRDEIPIFTINSSFINEDSVGYISLGRFAKITEEEMAKALSDLSEEGMKRLVLDLRWNAGGFLDQAVKIASMFLNGRKKIVYTEGRLSDFDEEFYTDTFSDHDVYDVPLIVLINNASASASEIVAGAIQDYDRGLIVGTTSFGKGLVQREFPLNDDSRLRLTISKYYTPSGRLIQRPYEGQEVDQYYSTVLDSMPVEATTDSSDERPIYHTSAGREVYGGGGITPDIIIEYDSGDKSSTLTQKLYQKRLFFETASKFATKLKYYKNDFQKYLNDYQVGNDVLEELKSLMYEKEIEFEISDFRKNDRYYKARIKAEIARNIWGNEKYYQVWLLNDNQYKKALSLFYKLDELLEVSGSRNIVEIEK